jgi:hypothetical protein
MQKKMWEHTGSNRGPSACKADALNQLSYAPILKDLCFPASVLLRFGSANIGLRIFNIQNNLGIKFSSLQSCLPTRRGAAC